ncbi:hypothetical protein [Arcticibacter tournemirensis]|uniref:Outer membrane insertion C-signal n=1 Tax=Arcticibacter tournemirensis TaxID=699437 RepID=A0A4Q0M8M9_9SPHI|nr:hypothetical protein [Arcticibacter tournemirensis]RXF69520.1 hypothetical protein EKH83_12660 [Arcticibacter tournemirensis]
MKRKLLSLIVVSLCLSTSLFAQSRASGTSYRTAAGLRVDVGDGSTGVGFNVKHFFTTTGALDASLLFFEGDVVGLEAEYEYNANIPNAPGLKWYAGLGPQLLFGNDDTAIAIRPVVGLEYKIPNVPLNFGFDWRPMFVVSPDTDTNAGRFGLSFRYAF